MNLITCPRREWHYVHKPSDYEYSPCPKCSGHNTWWSEWAGYIWCYDCEIDYKPASGGVFDGPVCMEILKLLGLSCDRVNVLTGEVETPRVENGELNYYPLSNLDTLKQQIQKQ